MKRDHILRINNEWVVDKLGRIIKFSEIGAQKYVKKHKAKTHSIHVMYSKAK